jgi:hypothetical protein
MQYTMMRVSRRLDLALEFTVPEQEKKWDCKLPVEAAIDDPHQTECFECKEESCIVKDFQQGVGEEITEWIRRKNEPLEAPPPPSTRTCCCSIV